MTAPTATPAQLAEATARMVAAKEVAERADAALKAARADLGAAILAARAAGMTVPQVAAALDWSQANVFRVSAQAKEVPPAARRANGKKNPRP